MSAAAEVLYDVSDGIATITINRADARNALNSAVRSGISNFVERFSKDESARVLILTAVGDIAFSAGADLKEMSDNRLAIPPADFIPDLVTHKPVIAAVNGVALGGGFFLAQQADLVIAADHATFGITEAKFGRGAPWAAALPLLIPPRVAMELIMTAQPISALRAKEVGLVNSIVPAVDLTNASREMAKRIASNAPLTVSAGKTMVREILSQVLGDAQSRVDEIWAPVYTSHDAQEGPLAFKEKRSPNWLGT
jgi:enoyl-CoA hydratase/carnithine racemase